MRILHTADWHLGRLFNGIHLTQDQAFVLDQLVDMVSEAQPDVMVIAGDVYDRAVPPPDAVALLDDTLSRIAVGLHVPVIVIAGNHDSPERVGFGARLMAAQNVHIFGRLSLPLAPVVLADKHGPVSFIGLPYAEPVTVRQAFAQSEIHDHESAMRALTTCARECASATARSVLIAHAFVSGGSPSDSERPLSLGGAETVSAECFDGFHYTALGHLHRPQQVVPARTTYSGSLLKYSFSEGNHEKGVTLVEMDGQGLVTLSQHPLLPRHDVRILEGTLAEIVARGQDDPRREDYVLVRLTDRGALVDPLGVVRDVYPHCLELDRSAFFATGSEEPGAVPSDHRSRSATELFSGFIQHVTSESATEEEMAVFVDLVNTLQRTDRES